MTWREGSTVTVRCPRCGSAVVVPVEIRAVDLVLSGAKDLRTLRVWFTEQINVEKHACVFTDGLTPVSRFVETGALDDTASS